MRSKITAFYTLNKSRKILRQGYRLYQRKATSLELSQKERIQSLLTSLQTAIIQKDAEIADRLAHSFEEAARRLMPKTMWDKIRDFTCALLFALMIAIAIRQTWFEFYTIPSGSARPTLMEGDFLLVSKTDFGINTLTPTGHLQFDPNLVQRGSTVVLSGKGMDISDVDTKYFLVIPGQKQYVKRLLGKPGDTLYFYGGEIYGVGADGKDLAMLRDSPSFSQLEHVPFIRFDGKVKTPMTPNQGIFDTSVFYQMNEPVAKLSLANGSMSGEMLAPVPNYFDLWGFKNFAMARILTPAEAKTLHPQLAKDLDAAPMYLELTHHPSIKNPRLVRDEYHRLRPELATSTSLLPMNQEALNRVMDHMTTCRFIVKNGVATRLGGSFGYPSILPRFKHVPDGTYEILDGKGYRVLWGGFTKRLAPDHPLLSKDPAHVQMLYNLGIEFDTRFAPSLQPTGLVPSRYAYFRNHDLYLLGAPVLQKSDPDLIVFLQKEYKRQALSNAQQPYYPFDDAGAPLNKDGSVDADFIRKFGLTIPPGMYLALGDNHAMSADSRQFGFVPEQNLRGGASLILWPPSSRWGRLPQPSIAHLTFPNLFVWAFFLILALSITLYLRRKDIKPLRF